MEPGENEPVRDGHADVDSEQGVAPPSQTHTDGDHDAPSMNDLTAVMDNHETAGIDGEDVAADVEVRDHSTVADVLSDVYRYFETADIDESFAAAPDEEFIATEFFDFSYLDEYQEVERYWVDEPFAYVVILFDERENEYRYQVVEPVLNNFEQYVRQDLVALLRNNLMYRDFEDDDERAAVFETEAKELITDHASTVEDGTLHKLLYYLLRDFLEYGPIDPIMRDPAIEDISCDGADVPVFVYHQRYRDLRSNVSFSNERLNAFTFRLAQRAGKQLTISDPLIDGTLPDGSRIQLTLGGEISTRGSNFTIRKFADIPYTPVDLINWNTFSAEQMAYFWIAIENNKSLIFAGGTGSGKTSSMNAVSFFIPRSSKVVTIEDTREIDLPHENWIQSVTRGGVTADDRGEVSMYRLLQSALRQRPEYLLVGEIRTEERVALTFFQAMSTGHTAYTTVHADSVETVLSRLQNPPLNVPTQMLQDLDIVSIQRQTFLDEKRVRRNEEIAEISAGTRDDSIDTLTVFDRDAATDTHEQVNESALLREIAEDRGWSERDLERELSDRERVLQYLVDNDITEYAAVARAINRYTRRPGRLLEQISDGSLDRAELVDEGPAMSTVTPVSLQAEDLF